MRIVDARLGDGQASLAAVLFATAFQLGVIIISRSYREKNTIQVSTSQMPTGSHLFTLCARQDLQATRV